LTGDVAERRCRRRSMMMGTSWWSILTWRRCTILAGRRAIVSSLWRAVLPRRRSVLTLWRAVLARRWLPVSLLLPIAGLLLAIGLIRWWVTGVIHLWRWSLIVVALVWWRRIWVDSVSVLLGI
jgi:hypothetical protein